MLKRNLVVILFVTLVLGWQLLRPGYYSMHDDLQVMRLFEIDRCFQNGQIPCRWVPDLGQNYGQPLFNYYSAFPYYLGEAFHLLGFTFVDTVKLLFLLSLFLSGLFVYLLAGEFINENSALITALVYLTAPYHAVDVFVRGALSESWGLALVPLVLFAIVRVCRQPKTSNAVILSLSTAALLTTHNITVLISMPIILVLSLYFFITNKNKRKQLVFLIPAGLLGVGLAAFFLFPVLLEQSYIQTKFLVTDYFDFRAHFVTFGQLFTKLTWGYGPSRFNSYQYPQTLSFFIGILPAIVLFITPLIVFLNLKKVKDKVVLFSLLYFLAVITIFMVHPRSVFIWEKIETLKFVQFPWRFLGPFSLLVSLLAGLGLNQLQLDRENEIKVVSFLIAFLIAANFVYFRFEKYFPTLTDTLKLSGQQYDDQIKGALLDYLPSTVKVIPNSKALSSPQALSGVVSTNYFDKRSNYFSSEFDILSDNAEVRFPVMDFPGWTLYQNRSSIPIKFDNNNDYGLITVKLNKGHQLIQAFFEDTPLRIVSNVITIGSGLLLTLWLVIVNQKNNED